MPPKRSSRIRSPTPPPVARERSITPVMPENLRGIRVSSPSRGRGRARGRARGRSRAPARGRIIPDVVVAPPPDDDEDEMEEVEAVSIPPTSQRGKNKKISDKDKIQKARNENEKEYDTYMTQGRRWKLLELQENPVAEDKYKNWAIPLDGYSLPTKIANYLDKVSREQLFFKPDFQNSWANKIYMLHLPDNYDFTQDDNFQEIRIEDIKNGLYLGTNDNATGAKIAQETEKGYLSNVLSLNTYKNYVFENNNVPPDNMNWLIEKEKDLLTDLMEQSMTSTTQKPFGLALTTFNGYIKSIRRYLKIMLGPNHELRIKYSVLYGMIDRGIQFMKGGNEAGGDDIMYFGDLIDITNWLYNQWVGRYGITIGKQTKTKKYTLYARNAPELFPRDAPENHIKVSTENLTDQAWKACLTFLGVAVMVWDYPSRTDKYSTVIIDDESKATGKETYLVVKKGELGPNNMPVWIYKKDIKDVGRPEVRVPMEYDGLAGWQRKLAEAIKLSLELYPRETLFANKNYYWDPTEKQKEKQDLVNNGKPKVISVSTIQGWVGDVNKDANLIEALKKLYKRQQINPIPKIGIAVFRRSFITYWSQNMNYNGRKKMIWGMLTSFTKAETYYRRDFTNPELRQRVKVAPPERDLTIDEEDFYMGGQEQGQLPKPANKTVLALDIDGQPPPPPPPPVILPAIRLTQPLIVQDANGNNVDFYQARAQGRGDIQVVNNDDDNEDEDEDEITVRQQPVPVPRPRGRIVPRPEAEIRKTNAQRQKRYVETQQADRELKKEYLAKRKVIDEKKTVKKMLIELNSGTKEWNKTQTSTKIKYELKLVNGKYVSGKFPELS
jgi:hypothetical protein